MPGRPASQTVLITGSTGLIGSRLARELEQDGSSVVRAVRHDPANPPKELRWDPTTGEIDRNQLNGVDAVVHLAGANIAGRRWTRRYKQLLRDSRVQGTRLLSTALADLDQKPRVLACASATGFYGDRGDAELDETASCGDGFLPEVCQQWEAACQPARDAGIRVVNIRIGVVLSPEGGALAKMLTPFRLGLGGVVGSGQQFFSWIALEDVVQGILFCLADESLSGPVNLVSPHPVTNREFTKRLGQILARPTVLPLPAMAARLALGEMADSLLLASTRVVPQKLATQGYLFRHATLESALKSLLGSGLDN